LIGKKLGMTQVYNEDGTCVPVTVLAAGPCTVCQVKTVEKDGYAAVQIGYGECRDKKLSKARRGHFEKMKVDLCNDGPVTITMDSKEMM